MQLSEIFVALFLGITGVVMGSIGINCYNKHGSIGKNFKNEPNYRYLVFMIIAALLVTLFGIYSGAYHQETANLLQRLK
jgi:hypothetical protein